MKARLILFLILLCLFAGSASAQKVVISIDNAGSFVYHDSDGNDYFPRTQELINQKWQKRKDPKAPILIEEGTRIHIWQSEPAPDGKYLSGWRSNPSGVSVTYDNNRDEWVFNVPSHNISFSPVYSDQEPFTVCLESDSARVPSSIYWDVLMSTKIEEYSYDAGMFITVDDETVTPVLDLDMNGSPDISIIYGESTHTYRVLSTNSVKGSITIKGLNMSRDTIYNSRYNPVTFVFDQFEVTEVNHGQKYSKTDGGNLKVVIKSTLRNDTDPYDAFFERDASGNVRRQGKVYMNKKLVDPSNYTVRRGSLEIIFTPQYLATLPNGKHVVEVEMPHGETVSSDVEIEGQAQPIDAAAANLPRTGDEENLLVWGSLGVAGILAFLLVL